MNKILTSLKIFLLCSCNHQIDSKILIGKWYRFEYSDQVPSGVMSIEFTRDSIFANSVLFSQKGTWTITDNLLQVPNPNDNLQAGELKLNLRDDNELVIEEKNGQEWGISLKKAENFFHFFKNSKGIELPRSSTPDLRRNNWHGVFNVYIKGSKSGTSISTDFSQKCQDLSSDLNKFYQSQLQYPIPKVHLFADTNIEPKSIDSIVQVLLENKIDSIYQVFATSKTTNFNISKYLFTKKIK